MPRYPLFALCAGLDPYMIGDGGRRFAVVLIAGDA
jgi:hypothetical protein